MSNENIYIGRGKQQQPQGFDNPILKFEIDLTKLKEQGMPFIREVAFKNGSKHLMLRLIAQTLRQPTEYATHSISIDTFDYEAFKKQKETAPQEAVQVDNEPTDDLPF